MTARITTVETHTAETEFKNPLTLGILRKFLADADLLGLPDSTPACIRAGVNGVDGHKYGSIVAEKSASKDQFPAYTNDPTRK